MEAGESIEETMVGEVFEETGLVVDEYELYSVYSGSRMKYRYPDGNEVVFVMFIFNPRVDLAGRIAAVHRTLLYDDVSHESLTLEFKALEEIDIEDISSVQRPLFADLKEDVKQILRT